MVRGHCLRRPSGKDSIGLHTSKTQKRLSRYASMPDHLPTLVKTFSYCTTHPTHLAPAKMGHGHGWAATTIIRGNKFAIVAIEYFTRYIEAKPLTTITSETVKKFFWQNIICRFRVPMTLTVDNGKQFDSDNFKEFCKSIGTKLAFTLAYHLESNRVVERANRVIFSAIANTLFNLRKGKWVEELPRVVWSHNTTSS